MYRSRLIVGMLALCAACSDSTTAPMPQGQSAYPAPDALNLVGIVELTEREPVHYVLRQADDQLVALVWVSEALRAMLGKQVVATGRFKDGGFVVEKMKLAASKPVDLDIGSLVAGAQWPAGRPRRH